MGYDLHITRRAHWADRGPPEITLEEWLTYVDADSEIQWDVENGPTDFVGISRSEEPWPLWWYRGEVYTKNPDDAAIEKLVAIAQRLGTRVLGDGGEEYPMRP